MLRVAVRLAFLVGCVLPTAGAAYLATVGWESSRAWHVGLEAALERPVTIGRVTTPTPGHVVLTDVAVGPTTGRPGKVVFPSVAIERSGRTALVFAPSAHLTDCPAETLATVAERLLLADRLPTDTASVDRVAAHVATLTVVTGGPPETPDGGRRTDVGPVPARPRGFTLTDVELSAERFPGPDPPAGPATAAAAVGPVASAAPVGPVAPLGPRRRARVRLAFSVAGASAAARSEIDLVRSDDAGRDRTTWTLDTHGADLPAEVIAYFVPVEEPDLTGAAFRGRIAGVRGDADELELTGTWTGVDLSRLVTDRFPHKLTGTAEATFRSLKFAGGTLISCAGDVRCEGGIVGESLLTAAAEHLGLTLTRPVNRNWPYSRLAVGFELTGDTFALAGHADADGSLIVDLSGPLLVEGPARRLDALALVRMLVPADGYAVPATAQTQGLLRVLPTPAIQSATTAELPRGTLRLR